MRMMRVVYKLKFFLAFFFEVYKLLREEIEFYLNLSQLYVETLQNLIMIMNLGGKYSFSLEYMQDEIQAMQDYTIHVYQ
jgi:hypothetical protein